MKYANSFNRCNPACSTLQKKNEKIKKNNNTLKLRSQIEKMKNFPKHTHRERQIYTHIYVKV